MANFQLFIFLMTLSVLLVAFAQRLKIPYPLALVLGGGALGFLPLFDGITLDPNLILAMTLPPILFYAAFTVSFRDFFKNWKEIFSLALGLVIATTCLVGLTFKWFFPEAPWALAFAFGAIVSPPDAAAAASILRRFSIAPRLEIILEGESLVNDASALVLYRLAVIALLSGSFSLVEAAGQFIYISMGGLLLGCLLGSLIYLFSKRYLEPVVAVMLSFVTPYIVYFSASALEVSGILATVAAGLIASRFVIHHNSSLRRLLTQTPWDIFIIFVNCFVFALIGLEIRLFISKYTNYELLLYVGYALTITLVMLVIRMFWVFSKHLYPYLKAQINLNDNDQCVKILKESIIVGWTGMRGIVSLVAALALPNEINPQWRDIVIMLTFLVILFSLYLPGLTLPLLLTKLNLHHHSRKLAIKKIRTMLINSAHDEIHRLKALEMIDDEEVHFLLHYFKARQRIYDLTNSTEKKSDNLKKAKNLIVQNQRHLLLDLWKKHVVDDKLLRQLETELDVEEAQTLRAELI